MGSRRRLRSGDLLFDTIGPPGRELPQRPKSPADSLRGAYHPKTTGSHDSHLPKMNIDRSIILT